MTLKHVVVGALRRQFGHPTGVCGRAVGVVLAHRPSNRRRNAWAVSLLDVRPHDRVLEVGFGPGLAIAQASTRAWDGLVCGIDHSATMLRQARRRNAEAIDAGRVDLRLASVEDLPAFGEPFDKILAVNAMLFWTTDDTALRNLRGLLRPGGVLAVCHQPRGPGATDMASTTEGRRIAAALERAGLTSVRVETLPLKPAVVCVLGVNGT